MDIDVVFKIAIIGVITAIINQILKMSGKEEFTTLVTLSAVVIVLFNIVSMVAELFSTIKTIFNMY
ncbi:MAG: stage III sporulation protein AC [Clostridia bacterium]|jgi:stage III sporulation protein AC|nr:stage III sporulation protein AC [Clostridia bacterium]